MPEEKRKNVVLRKILRSGVGTTPLCTRYSGGFSDLTTFAPTRSTLLPLRIRVTAALTLLAIWLFIVGSGFLSKSISQESTSGILIGIQMVILGVSLSLIGLVTLARDLVLKM